MQDDPLIRDLRAEFNRARTFNLSAHGLLQRANVPVGRSTLYRWMSGKADPQIGRVRAVLAAVRKFLGDEQKRLAHGAVTAGGPLTTDAEFMTMSRGGVTVRLKEQEFKLLEAVRSTRGRPAFLDWLSDSTGLGKSSLHRAACELRRKLKSVDFEMVTLPGRSGEPPAYTLSDRAVTKDAA